MKAFEVIGEIAIIQPSKGGSKKDIQKLVKKIMQLKNIKTVALKTGRVKGRLRTRKFSVIWGKRTFETIHKENNCLIKLNIETCYFSPRLANERLELAKKVKRGEKVLVMFSGVAPFALVIGKNSKAKKIVAVELNREACRYAKESVKLNKINNVEIIQGDVKKVIPEMQGKFDRVIMPRPQLKETFLHEAFLVSKKNTVVHFYDFAEEEKIKEVEKKILREAKKYKEKIKFLKIKKAGDIAPRKYRIRADFKILS